MTGSLLGQAAATASRIQELARSEEWDRVREQVVGLNDLMTRIPEADRRQALQIAARCAESVQELASSARQEVVRQLSELRKGQKARESYEAAGPLP